MTDLKLPIEGHCRCGKVRIRIAAPPLLTMACHCTGCQRMSASAYSLGVAIPSAGFAVIAGETAIGGLHGDVAQHYHCDWCKSWMFTCFTGDVGFVNVRPTMLENSSWFVPFIETCTSEALPWAKTPAVRSFAQFPELSEFPELIAAFSAR